MTNTPNYVIIIIEKDKSTPNKEDKKMLEEMSEMVAAEMFGASFEEMLKIAGVTLEEFYEDYKKEYPEA